MANSRMYIRHKYSGLTIFIGKSSGMGFYPPDDLTEQMDRYFNCLSDFQCDGYNWEDPEQLEVIYEGQKKCIMLDAYLAMDEMERNCIIGEAYWNRECGREYGSKKEDCDIFLNVRGEVVKFNDID